MKTILLSGGFDPIHVGHIRMIREAQEYGTVVIALNSDEWLIRKKGFYSQSWKERAEILQDGMDLDVVSVQDDDGSVCDALTNIKPTYFGNGGDRTNDNVPEVSACENLGIEMVFGLGGGKIQSSSRLVHQRVTRLWGHYETVYDGEFKVKILTLEPGHGISVQRHKFRNEHWIMPLTDAYHFVPKDAIHSLTNESSEPMVVVEVQTGTALEESDIEHPELSEESWRTW